MPTLLPFALSRFLFLRVDEDQAASVMQASKEKEYEMSVTKRNARLGPQTQDRGCSVNLSKSISYSLAIYVKDRSIANI
jgi:hypothetical protein